MGRHFRRAPAAWRSCRLLALSAALAGCGGDPSSLLLSPMAQPAAMALTASPPPVTAPAPAAAEAVAPAVRTAVPTSPARPARRSPVAPTAPASLWAMDGLPAPSPAWLLPEDPRHRSRAGLYATPEQLAHEATTVGPYTYAVDLGSGVDAAVSAALAAFQWRGSPANDPVAHFVVGDDPEAVAQVADRLFAAGLRHVFVVRRPAGATAEPADGRATRSASRP